MRGSSGHTADMSWGVGIGLWACLGVPKNREQPVLCTPAVPTPGMVAVAGESLHCQGVPAFPGDLAAPVFPFWLHPRVFQQDNGTTGGEIPPEPRAPPSRNPSVAWDVLTPCSCFPGDGFSGFQGKMWARAKENRFCVRSSRSHPAQVPVSLSLG